MFENMISSVSTNITEHINIYVCKYICKYLFNAFPFCKGKNRVPMHGCFSHGRFAMSCVCETMPCFCFCTCNPKKKEHGLSSFPSKKIPKACYVMETLHAMFSLNEGSIGGHV